MVTAASNILSNPSTSVVEEGGERVEILMYSIDDAEWTLEIVDADGCPTVWEEPFESDEAALAEALNAIKDEGIKSFLESVATSDAIH